MVAIFPKLGNHGRGQYALARRPPIEIKGPEAHAV
jgi:hypothetical protein